jgi:hypothetical protein
MRNLKTKILLYGYYMAQIFESYFEFIVAVLLIVIIISVYAAIIPQAIAHAPSDGNMTAPMLESTRFHLKAADELISKGDTISALRQINLAEIQLSLLYMGSQGTSMNTSQAIEFITGGSLSSVRMGANCIIDNQAMASCMR